MLDREGKPYCKWEDNTYTMCPCYPPWRFLLANSLKKISHNIAVEGFYIDEFGFGMNTSNYRYCSHPAHQHLNFDLQLGEFETLSVLRSYLPNHILYTEETPNDVTMTLLNGSLSTAAKHAIKLQREVPILLTRFLYPWFKVIELLTEFSMCTIDITSNSKTISHVIIELMLMIKVTLWNGNAVYVPKSLAHYD
jgi:hypothetical protein